MYGSKYSTILSNIYHIRICLANELIIKFFLF